MNSEALFTASETTHLRWFLRLRWFAFFGQILVLLGAVYGLKLSIPILPVLAALACIPVTELIYRRIAINNRRERVALGSLLIIDTLILTAILYFTGGPTNPFSLVYLVHVVLSAVLLGATWAWASAVFSTLCFSFLFLWHQPIHEFHHMDHGSGLSLHLKGMLFSYMLVAALVAYFLNKILAELRDAEDQVKQLANNQLRLASLTTLSTNAAHNLGTPLASIDLIVHELENALEKETNSTRLRAHSDLKLLKSQVQRCTEIISDLCESSGNITGDSPKWHTMEELFGGLVLPAHTTLPDGEYYVQKRPLRSALTNILKNAQQSGQDPQVTMVVTFTEGALSFEITDKGDGIPADLLQKVREPFFTTRSTGMGLGVYIAEMVVQQLGGSLNIESTVRAGTTVTLVCPASYRDQLEEVAN